MRREAASILSFLLPGSRFSVVMGLLAGLKLWAFLLFTSGFLLNRNKLQDRSTCSEFPLDQSTHVNLSLLSEKAAGCWTATPVDKVVLVIIDGARFDFAHAEVQSTQNQPDVPLHFIDALRRKGACQTELFRFVADPPTTTHQRLKGLLTGGLPTFLDIGDSFEAKLLSEDNFIVQAAAAGRRVSLAGDDTWLRLLNREHFSAGIEPYPSFNVKDLDTVDQGVRQHLLSAIAQPLEWDLLIGHFLGVDHAGHTHGVNSAEMSRKLDEIDTDVKNVAAALEADEIFDRTILIVLGDHGMTDRGDHGGSTPEETDSFIVIYHPRAGAYADKDDHRCPRNGQVASPEVMLQTDFASSISLLLGLPIPFGSIGSVPKRFFEVASACTSTRSGEKLGYWSTDGCQKADLIDQYLSILRATATQVWRYFRKYHEVGGSLTGLNWLHLEQYFVSTYARNISDSERTDRLLVFLSYAAELARENWVKFQLWRMVAAVSILCLVLGFQIFLICITSQICCTTSCDKGRQQLLSGLREKATFAEHNIFKETCARAQNFETTCVVIFLLVGFACRLSNSCIAAEEDVMFFLMASFAVSLGIRSFSTFGSVTSSSFMASEGLVHASTLGIFMCNVLLKGLGTMWMKGCSLNDTYFDRLSSGMSSPLQLYNILSAVPVVGVVALFPWVCLHTIPPNVGWGQRCSVALSLSAICIRVLFRGAPIHVLRLFFRFSSETINYACDSLLPLCTYFAPFIGLLLSHYDFTQMTGDRAAVAVCAHSNVWLLMPILVILSGKFGPSLGLLATTQVSFLVHGITYGNKCTHPIGVFREVTLSVALNLMSSHFFFSGGQRCVFDALHFSCAFTGFQKFNFFLMGSLLTMKTWSGDILLCTNLPAIAAMMCRYSFKQKYSECIQVSIVRLTLLYSLFRSLAFLTSAVVAAVERHHLMIWEVFAPKLFFDAYGMFTSELLLVYGVLIGSRARNSLKSLNTRQNKLALDLRLRAQCCG